MPKNPNDQITEAIAKMRAELTAAEEEAAKVKGGNKAAVTRLRQHMQEVKTQAQNVREAALAARDAA